MFIINIISKFKEAIRGIPRPWGQSSFDSYNVNYDLFVKKAYENPFIQAPFKEMVTDLKALKFQVVKDGEVSESVESKYVMNSLKRPNKELSRSDLIEALTTYLIFGGRCMLYRVPGVYKTDVYVYNPISFQIVRNDNTLEIERVELGDTTIGKGNLDYYHIIKMFDPNDLIAGKGSGYSCVKPLAMVGDMLNYLMIHNNSLLKNGGRIAGVYTLPRNVSQQQLDEIKNKISSQGGHVEAGKVAFIQGGEGTKFDAMATNPKDLDWIEGMKELQKIICRVLGIPEALIMSENSTYNNLEGFKKKVYQDTIVPFANKICEELTEFFKNDLAEGEEIVVDTSNIKALQIDVAKEIKLYAESLEGRITTNDFIIFINKAFELAIPLLEKGLGDKILVKTSMMFLDELGVQYEPAAQENTSQQG